jgi:hypothetical protein
LQDEDDDDEGDSDSDSVHISMPPNRQSNSSGNNRSSRQRGGEEGLPELVTGSEGDSDADDSDADSDRLSDMDDDPDGVAGTGGVPGLTPGWCGAWGWGGVVGWCCTRVREGGVMGPLEWERLGGGGSGAAEGMRESLPDLVIGSEGDSEGGSDAESSADDGSGVSDMDDGLDGATDTGSVPGLTLQWAGRGLWNGGTGRDSS